MGSDISRHLGRSLRPGERGGGNSQGSGVAQACASPNNHRLSVTYSSSALRVREMRVRQGILLEDHSWISKQGRLNWRITPAAQSKPDITYKYDSDQPTSRDRE